MMGSLLSWISRAHTLEVKSFSRGEAESIFRIYLDVETVEKHRDVLLEFAKRVEHLPIAVVVGADMLRTELDPVPEAARGLRLEFQPAPHHRRRHERFSGCDAGQALYHLYLLPSLRIGLSVR